MASSVASSIRDKDNDEEEEDLYGPPPTDTAPASVLAVRAVDAPDNEHINNYDMLNDVDDDYTLSEKMVHYVGGHIMPEHWRVCNAVLVFHAGAGVSKLATMTMEKRNEMTLEAFNLAMQHIATLDTTHFCPKGIAFFRHTFRNKTKPMNGSSVWRSDQRCRKEIRNVILPLFPADFNSMKSGRVFHESINGRSQQPGPRNL